MVNGKAYHIVVEIYDNSQRVSIYNDGPKGPNKHYPDDNDIVYKKQKGPHIWNFWSDQRDQMSKFVREALNEAINIREGKTSNHQDIENAIEIVAEEHEE